MSVALGWLLRLSLLVMMLALGLGLRPEGLAGWLRRPELLLRVLLGSCLLVPLMGLLLLNLPGSAGLDRSARIAVGLMALCPSAPLAMRKAGGGGGDPQLAALLQVAAALLAILTVPALALLYRHSFALAGWELRPIQVAHQVVQVQVLPLLVALGLRRWRPQLADRCEDPLRRLADGLLLLVVSLVLFQAGPLLLSWLLANPSALAMMAALAAAALVIGRLMAGWSSQQAATAALVTAMRNPGLALLFAGRHGQDLNAIRAAVILQVLVTLLVSLPILGRPVQADHDR